MMTPVILYDIILGLSLGLRSSSRRTSSAAVWNPPTPLLLYVVYPI